jgi:hypothetical protein
MDTLINQTFSDYLPTNTTDIEFITDKNMRLDSISNMIIYGPSGSGKYTKSLKIIQKFSNSSLKYSKKIMIANTKTDITLKISDIHFEIDMELLGCNAKIMWNDIFTNIIDIITGNDNKGIILCKNFHSINNELLDIFYSYMQSDIFANTTIRFILLTECLAFMPSAILNTCNIITCAKFTKIHYKREFGVNNIPDIGLINNLKALSFVDQDIDIEDFTNIMRPYTKICDSILEIIDESREKNIDFTQIRRILYDVLIYNLNIYDCITYIISSLIETGKISQNSREINEDLLDNTYHFFKLYNNNYRPIYHLENYVLYLIKLVHEL